MDRWGYVMQRREFMKDCAGLAVALAVPAVALAKADRWHCQYHQGAVEIASNDIVDNGLNVWPTGDNTITTAKNYHDQLKFHIVDPNDLWHSFES